MLNVLLFVTCYLGGFVLAFFGSPVWAFVLYQLVYFSNPLSQWWGYMIPSLSYSLFTVVLMMGVFAKSYTNLNSNKLVAAPPIKWMYFVCIAYLIANYYAVYPSLNESASINFLKLVIIISLAYKLIDTDKCLDRVLAGYIGGAAYMGFMIYQIGRNAGDRVSGLGMVDAPDTNGVAAALAPALPLLIYFFWQKKNIKIRFFVVVAGAFIANAIVLINSRGAFLASIAGVGYFMMLMFFSKYRVRYQRATVVLLGIMGLVSVFSILDKSAIDRFFSMKEQELTEEHETGATRVFYWIAAIEMAKDHPFGGGARAFQYYAPEYIPQEVNTGGSRNRAVHSSWFEALSDLGYPGLFFLVFLVISSFRALQKVKSAVLEEENIPQYYKIVAIEAALISFLVAMTFLNRFRAEILYWLVLFISASFNVYVLKKDESGVKSN